MCFDVAFLGDDSVVADCENALRASAWPLVGVVRTYSVNDAINETLLSFGAPSAYVYGDRTSIMPGYGMSADRMARELEEWGFGIDRTFWVKAVLRRMQHRECTVDLRIASGFKRDYEIDALRQAGFKVFVVHARSELREIVKTLTA